MVAKRIERADDDANLVHELVYVRFPMLVEQLIERLAALEHEQWMQWAETIMAKESISEERRKRWAGYMVPYADLSEEAKQQDRKWARRVVGEIVEVLKR